MLGGVNAELGADDWGPNDARKRRWERDHGDLTSREATSSHPPSVQAVMDREFNVPLTWQSGETAASLIWAAWSVLASRWTGSKNVEFGATSVEKWSGEAECLEQAESSIWPVHIHVDGGQDTKTFMESIREKAAKSLTSKLTRQNAQRSRRDAKAACSVQTILIVSEEESSTAGFNSKLGAYALVLSFWPQGSKIKVQAKIRSDGTWLDAGTVHDGAA